MTDSFNKLYSEGKKEKLSHEEKFKKMHKLLDSLAPEYGVQ